MPNTKNIDKYDELTEKLSRAKAIYFTDYLGLNVGDMTELRSKFFQCWSRISSGKKIPLLS